MAELNEINNEREKAKQWEVAFKSLAVQSEMLAERCADVDFKIKEAVTAERERCAKIAIEFYFDDSVENGYDLADKMRYVYRYRSYQ